MKRTFNVVIEKDEDGMYVGSVPELPGCHTQGATLKELRENVVEAIEAYLESIENEHLPVTKFLKVQKVEVALQ